MEKNNSSVKFLEGAVVGLVLGVAANMFLSSKTGKKMKEDIKESMADFYKYIAPKIEKIKKMSEGEYKEFMKTAVIQYGKAKKLSQEKIKQIMQEAQKSWDNFSEKLQSQE